MRLHATGYGNVGIPQFWIPLFLHVVSQLKIIKGLKRKLRSRSFFAAYLLNPDMFHVLFAVHGHHRRWRTETYQQPYKPEMNSLWKTFPSAVQFNPSVNRLHARLVDLLEISSYMASTHGFYALLKQVLFMFRKVSWNFKIFIYWRLWMGPGWE